jgi:polysaccharide export outer membrane protein
MNHLPTYRLSLIAICSSIALTGCLNRGYTKARSDIEQEAESKGEGIRGYSQDREIYADYIKKNNELLYSLIKSRTSNAPQGEYRIGTQDVLSVQVFDVPSMSQTVRVSQSGTISLPLVGEIQVEGLTVPHAQEVITNSLRTQLKRPLVTLEVAQYGSHEVAVIGAVASPGTISLEKGVSSLVEILNTAGGVTDSAGNYLTLVPSSVSGFDRGIELPLGTVLGLNGNPPLEVPIHGGDTVIVQPAGQVLVEGEVEQRGSYAISDNITLIGALAAAGGITYGAKYDEVEVMRRLNENEVVSLVFDLEKINSGEEENPLLKNGDIIRVPSDTTRRMSQDIFESLRRLIGFGGRLPM